MRATDFVLDGLEPDNFLAFLALLGALRSLDVARPQWEARVLWRSSPRRPTLIVTSVNAIAVEEMLRGVDAGIETIAAGYNFGDAKDVKFSRLEARQILSEAVRANDEDRASVFAALLTDGAIREQTNVVHASDMVTMAGQGHQHFLTRLAAIPRLTSVPIKSKKGAPQTTVDTLRAALLAPWTRTDATDAFRWDPAEDRRYALRDVNPSTDAVATQHGANRLAAVAVPLLVAVPTRRRGSAAVVSRGFSVGRERRRRVTWPIWTKPLGLQTILALLDRLELHRDVPELEPLQRFAIEAAYRSYRLSNGYFANFSRGDAFTGTLRGEV